MTLTAIAGFQDSTHSAQPMGTWSVCAPYGAPYANDVLSAEQVSSVTVPPEPPLPRKSLSR